VIGPGGHDHRIPIFCSMLLFAIEYEGRFTLLDAEELVDFRVDLIANLFAGLHRAEASDKPRIAVAPIPTEGLGAAIADRLQRASAPASDFSRSA